MKIVSKKTAMKILNNSQNLKKRKLDAGKYAWKGTQRDFIGKEVPDFQGVHAVFVERRQDSYGPFARIYCITEN